MPIPKPESGELEKDYISRCISDIASEYDAEGQAYAVCKGEFDKSVEMQSDAEIAALPEPKASEGREQYIRRCLPNVYKAGGKYDQRVGTAMCATRYEKSNALASRKLDSFSSVARKIKLYFGDEQLEDDDPCQPGYTQYGMKDGDDGRPVPNCVPDEKE